ncbi:hypothetical protein [Barnesiella sp. An55]|uniref:hypothetical protein n=1 Tax=Barnesiella sp. An55 TaxID=1965646 RepID=UPI000B378C1E|nr:hypothetical protein [Barnesiella sp. An55]OUN71189.1 hypothetical protein B5G10_09555 [Barnesiella sp. An55]HIZ26179.1 hypothetical protein [Candidatus Barnesiella merdipullorum]
MTGKPSKLHPRTPHDWEQLIERYYAGETSLREEEELRRYLFSKESGDRYNDTRAVLSFTETGRRIATPRPPMHKSRRVALHTWMSAAACIALVLGGSIAYMTVPRNTCVAYVYGEKQTDPEVVIEQMRQSVSQFASTDDVTVESQLDAIFSPLENQP